MVQDLVRLFTKEEIDTPQERLGVATLCSIVSIILNFLLFTSKLIGGTISGSVAVTADAFNNLADAGTCLAELAGFQIASVGAGKRHPFGHGRIEWLMGLFAAIAVLFMGYEMIKTSIQTIRSPQPIDFGFPVFIILIVSIVVKVCMYFYNKNFGLKISSVTMQAKAYDCIGDIAATAAVLVSALTTHMAGWRLDGWCGILVSAFILYAGFQALNETISPIIGAAPDQELVERIEQVAGEYAEVIEIYDIMVHDYGFHKLVVSCHIGGSPKSDVKGLVRIADHIADRLFLELHCEAVIQVDLISTDISLHNEILSLMTETAQRVDTAIKVNDLRILVNTSSPRVCLELMMPYRLAKQETEIKHQLEKALKKIDVNYRLLARIVIYTIPNKHKKLS